MAQKIDRGTRRVLKVMAAGGLAAAAGLPGASAFAQGKAPEAGFEYRAVKPPQATEPPGKLEVLEFFWYGCPHCNSLEPTLKEWVKKLPPDVAFRKVHVAVNPAWAAHQQLFYTLDSLGKTAELNDRIFQALHVDKVRLDKPEQMADFVAKYGVDRKQFLDTWESFGVRTKMRKADSLAAAYKLDGVPAMGVNGKWFTAPSMAGGNAQSLQVIDFLLAQERKGGGK
jgi:thiol:disulfide interchange protein DsbA